MNSSGRTYGTTCALRPLQYAVFEMHDQIWSIFWRIEKVTENKINGSI